MELDQPHHRVDVLGRVAQGRHAGPGHAGAHHLVMVKGHAAVGDGPRLRLAHIVEQRGQSKDAVLGRLVHHGQRVGQHVLVAVDGVLFEGQPRQFGQEVGGQAGPHDEPECLGGHVDHDHLVQLVADAFPRHDGEAVVHRLDGGLEVRVGLEVETGGEARRPQHAEWIVAE
jgi:hypothetical protein